MPFDPTKPANGAFIVAADLRSQFNSLYDDQRLAFVAQLMQPQEDFDPAQGPNYQPGHTVREQGAVFICIQTPTSGYQGPLLDDSSVYWKMLGYIKAPQILGGSYNIAALPSPDATLKDKLALLDNDITGCQMARCKGDGGTPETFAWVRVTDGTPPSAM